MGKQQTQDKLPLSSHFASRKILGSFCLKTHRYWILCSENSFESASFESTSFELPAEKSFRHLPENVKGSVVGQFDLNNQHCIIIEMANDLTDNCHLEVTTLLTARELQIVHLVARGHSNKQVAHQLSISEWTVSTHLRRIFAKLGVDSRAEMVYRCSSLLN